AREEVVLDEPEVVEALPVGEHALLERFLVEPVPVDVLARERSLRLVEQAEFHDRLPSDDGGIRGDRNTGARARSAAGWGRVAYDHRPIDRRPDVTERAVMRRNGSSSCWAVSVLMVAIASWLAGCASTGSSTLVPITDVKSLAGKWAGVVDGPGSNQQDL